MLNSLKEFFETHVRSNPAGMESAPVKTIEFAAAVLMFEISRADSNISNEERKIIDEALPVCINH